LFSCKTLSLRSWEKSANGGRTPGFFGSFTFRPCISAAGGSGLGSAGTLGAI
jgi:hypothetical protein